MALTIKSPYSGKPVKVRDQDIGRSLRDESGHIFYVLPTADGTDYYAAKTRVGSLKEEQAYAELQPQEMAPTDNSTDSTTPAYDATGKRRKPWRLIVLLIILIFALAAFCSYFWMRNMVPFEQQIKNSLKNFPVFNIQTQDSTDKIKLDKKNYSQPVEQKTDESDLTGTGQ